MTNGQDFPQAPVFVKDRVIGPGHPQFFTVNIAIGTFQVKVSLRIRNNIFHHIRNFSMGSLVGVPDYGADLGFADQFFL